MKRRLFSLLVLWSPAFALHAAEPAPPDPPNTQWLSYNGNVNGQRYADLRQINTGNVGQLGEICRLVVDEIGSFHSGILEIDGTLYVTTATDTLAVDATNCALRWRHHYETEEHGGNALQVNRGVAYASGRLFRGTVDGRLLAIDAQTGKTLWQYQIGDPQQGEFFAAAPQVFQGLVILGAAGGDWGIRGRVMAFDAATGREVWRFNTIPRDGEAGAETWENAPSARYGGGGTWTTYTLDMAAGEVFIPVGNPAPDFLPEHRPGENLYTNSLVVLDAATGRLKWYHQLLSNDGLDLDLGAAPALYFDGKGERMVAFGGKDGFLYGVNRETKTRVFKTPVTTVAAPRALPDGKTLELCPGILGGVEWNGPAYDRANHALVVGSVDWCATLTRDDGFKYEPGRFNFGGSYKQLEKSRGWIVAVDADTGAVRWKVEMPAPQISGITPTAGGLVFAGDIAGNFVALDSKTGERLYSADTGGAHAGGVITYMRDNRQYVAFTSGNVSRLTFGVAGKPSLVLYGLGGKTPAPPAAVPVTGGAAHAPDAAAGREIFGKVCAACHGAQAEGGTGPSLKGLAARLDFDATVRWIENPSAVKPGTAMPTLYPSPLDAQQVRDVAAYVQTLQ
ncbi:MAG TPA: PQQ-binding-like beta-propeller repeat protein [Gammaproteobacteria bacterium]|nr:PQQ-binding-like beta-propeller repeat protein [Gammaproteobacteria bacterium]